MVTGNSVRSTSQSFLLRVRIGGSTLAVANGTAEAVPYDFIVKRCPTISLPGKEQADADQHKNDISLNDDQIATIKQTQTSTANLQP